VCLSYKILVTPSLIEKQINIHIYSYTTHLSKGYINILCREEMLFFPDCQVLDAIPFQWSKFPGNFWKLSPVSGTRSLSLSLFGTFQPFLNLNILHPTFVLTSFFPYIPFLWLTFFLFIFPTFANSALSQCSLLFYLQFDNLSLPSLLPSPSLSLSLPVLLSPVSPFSFPVHYFLSLFLSLLSPCYLSLSER
jgi:hypothetical protein